MNMFSFFDKLFLKKEEPQPQNLSIDLINNETDTEKEYIVEIYPANTETLLVGDPVNIWLAPDHQRIILYTVDSIPGEGGRIGDIPKYHLHYFVEHLKNGRTYDSEITEITAKKIKVHIIPLSEEEIKRRRKVIDNEYQIYKATRIRNELLKKYSPKSPIEISINLPEGLKISKKAELILNVKPKEFYFENPDLTLLEFEDPKTRQSFNSNFNMDVTLRVLRAIYSGTIFEISITHSSNNFINILLTPLKPTK